MFEDIVQSLNEGYSVETENYVRKEFFNLVQIATVFCYIRSPFWLVLHVIHVGTFYFVLIFFTISMLITGYNMKEYQVSLMGQAFHIGAGMILAMAIGFAALKNRKYFIPMMTLMATNYYSYGNTNITKEISEKCRNEFYQFKTKLFTFLPIYVLFLGVVGVMMGPFLDQWQGLVIEQTYINGVYMGTLIPIWFPFVVDNSFKKYFALAVVMLGSGIVLIQICTGIMTLIFIIHGVSTQLRILVYSVKNIEIRALELYEEKYGEKIKITDKYHLYKDQRFCSVFEDCLKQNIQHHQMVIKGSFCVDMCQRWAMFCSVFILALVIACALFTLIKGDERLSPQILSGLLLLLEATSIATICWRGQELIDLSQRLIKVTTKLFVFQSEDLSLALFSIEWIHCPQHIKKTILIMQERCKQPLIMNAGGFLVNPFIVNWEMFAGILNSAYTCFNLMYAMK